MKKNLRKINNMSNWEENKKSTNSIHLTIKTSVNFSNYNDLDIKFF